MKKALIFGTLAPPLHEQLGLDRPRSILSPMWQWQKDADVVTRLRQRDLLTEAEAKKLHGRIVRRIERWRHEGEELPWRMR